MGTEEFMSDAAFAPRLSQDFRLKLENDKDFIKLNEKYVSKAEILEMIIDKSRQRKANFTYNAPF